MEDFNIDPEAGIPAGNNPDMGAVEGFGRGTGEGAPRYAEMDFDHYFQNVTDMLDQQRQKRQQKQQNRMNTYEQIGNALLGGPLVPGTGFDMDWLNERLAAGSANGAHL